METKTSLTTSDDLQDQYGRLKCTKERPFDKSLGQYWFHPNAFEEDDFGETAGYKCPICNHYWIEELPQ